MMPRRGKAQKRIVLHPRRKNLASATEFPASRLLQGRKLKPLNVSNWEARGEIEYFEGQLAGAEADVSLKRRSKGPWK
jgi:hypothetical protein